MSWWQWLLVSLAVVLGVYAAFVAWLVILGRRDDAHALARFIPDCIVLVTRLAREPRVSRRRKLLLVALIGYLALPFDLVPDFIPVAGQLDDAIIVAGASACPRCGSRAMPPPPGGLAAEGVPARGSAIAIMAPGSVPRKLPICRWKCLGVRDSRPLGSEMDSPGYLRQ
jgi:Protein of unknown function (DUF1232)